MVRYDNILNVINGYVEKCSNNELKSRLEQMTFEEKKEKLIDILSTDEYEEYKRSVHEIDLRNEYIESYKEWAEKSSEDSEYWQNRIKEEKEQIKETEEKILQYELKIFRKHEPKEYSLKGYNEGVSHEQNEINNQKSNNYTKNELNALKSYFKTGFHKVNFCLWRDEPLDKTTATKSRLLSKAINKNGLTQNTILYNGGHYPNGKIGDSITFKGFTSTSYDLDSAESFEEGCIYKFLAPKGTPCFNANMSGTSNFSDEHECLLDKNLSGKIVGFDGEYKGVPVVVVQL